MIMEFSHTHGMFYSPETWEPSRSSKATYISIACWFSCHSSVPLPWGRPFFFHHLQLLTCDLSLSGTQWRNENSAYSLGTGKSVHVFSCRFIFRQVTCLVRVPLQFCTPSRPSTLLAISQRLGRISCYSPLSHLPPVTTSIQPLPVMVPFQYQAFLLQVKVSSQSNLQLLNTAISGKRLKSNLLLRSVGKAADQNTACLLYIYGSWAGRGKLGND